MADQQPGAGEVRRHQRDVLPGCKRSDDDAWQAFPEQRLRLLETIRTRRIKNVVFVSGDVHGSLTSA
jgi:phosphodiesterase/alkaline phosphatase D-like protein